MQLSLFILFSGLVFQIRSANAVEYTGRSFKDPFNTLEDLIVPTAEPNAPPAARPSIQQPHETLILEGVVWDSDHPQAIINGKIVDLGSRIGAMEVMAIEKDGVRIRENGQELILRQRGRE